MGFFLSDEESENLQTTARKGKVKLETIIDPTKRGCDHCSLKYRWPQLLGQQMPLTGNYDAEVLILGDAPSYIDDQKGEPFNGENGDLLMSFVPRRMHDKIAKQNSVRCAVEDGSTPSASELHACGEHLEGDIALLPNLRVIIGVGAVPLSRFLPGITITEVHGIKFPVKIGKRTFWYYPVLHPSMIQITGGEWSYMLPILKADMARLWRHYDSWDKPFIYKFDEKDVTICETEDEARRLLDSMYDPIAVDIETSCLRPYQKKATIATAAFSDGATTIAFSCGHPENRTTWGLKLLLETVQKRKWVAHSAGMELSWFWWEIGTDWLPTEYEDTMAIGRIFHERERLQSLEDMTAIHLGLQKLKSLSNVDTKRIMFTPLAKVLPYNGLDALATILVYHHLIERVDKFQYRKLVNTTRSCVAMELSGLPIDREYAEQLHKDHVLAMDRLTDEARDIYEVRQFELHKGVGFNIGSPEHVAIALNEFGHVSLPYTDKGKGKRLSTDDSVLEQVAKINPLARVVRDWREISKLDSTYVLPVANGTLIMPDGLMHPGYTTTFTKTLRLSGEDPNIQNWPRRKNGHIRNLVNAYIKALGWNQCIQVVEAPEGHLIVAFDYGQLEARVIAMASHDAFLCKAILEGYDIHSDWRDKLLKIFPEYWDRLIEKSGETEDKKLLKAGRDNIKNDFVFASFFGSSPKSCAEYTNCPLEVMEELQQLFWRTFSGVKRWMGKQRRYYQDTGSVVTLTGRRRSSILPGNETINTQIQGSASDIVLDAQNALCDLAVETHDLYLMPRINIHDDLTFILPDDDRLPRYIETIAQEMIRPRFDWITTPLMVEVSIGATWGAKEEIAKFTGRYHR